jgi:hypothetical protein
MIIRTNKRYNPYTILDNGFLNDSQLSLKAKGLLAYLLSRPDDWQVYVRQLTETTTDGLVSIKNAIKELEAMGYVEKQQNRSEGGQFGHMEYIVREEPSTKPQHNTANRFPASGKHNTTNNLYVPSTRLSTNVDNLADAREETINTIPFLTAYYASLVGKRAQKRDYAIIGRLCKEFAPDKVRAGLDCLKEAFEYNPNIRQPLWYLRRILSCDNNKKRLREELRGLMGGFNNLQCGR